MIIPNKRFAFISYSKEDRQYAEVLAGKMKEYAIRSWVAFRDIPPGEVWDVAIERAIEKAYFVCVIVSKRSTSSSYVRAEVENAIRAGKSIVPIRIDETELPLRWGMFQSIDWHIGVKEDEYEKLSFSEHTRINTIDCVVRNISRIIPQCTMRELNEHLADITKEKEVKALLTTYYEWIPDSEIRHARLSYSKKDSRWGKLEVNKLIKGEKIDILLGREDSDCWRSTMVYLGSPYDQAISTDASLSNGFKKILHRAERHMRSFPAGDDYNVYLVFGRREQWSEEANNIRKSLQEEWKRKFSHYYGSDLFIMSYDRLLEKAQM